MRWIAEYDEGTLDWRKIRGRKPIVQIFNSFNRNDCTRCERSSLIRPSDIWIFLDYVSLEPVKKLFFYHASWSQGNGLIRCKDDEVGATYTEELYYKIQWKFKISYPHFWHHTLILEEEPMILVPDEKWAVFCSLISTVKTVSPKMRRGVLYIIFFYHVIALGTKNPSVVDPLKDFCNW